VLGIFTLGRNVESLRLTAMLARSPLVSERELGSYGQVEGQLAQKALETLFSVTGEK